MDPPLLGTHVSGVVQSVLGDWLISVSPTSSRFMRATAGLRIPPFLRLNDTALCGGATLCLSPHLWCTRATSMFPGLE